MRTQTLLLTAALGLAATATTMAQVYSVNAVGYVNTPIVKGYQIINNPLMNQTSNKIDDLFPQVAGLVIYKFVGGTYIDPIQYDPDLGGWSDNAAPVSVVPGEGFWVFAPADAPANLTVTFVGEVMQGTAQSPLIIDVPNGYSILSSKVPQAGKLQTDLGYPAPGAGETIYKFDPTYEGNPPAQKGYDVYTFDPDLGGWSPEEPSVKVGEGFWVYNPGTAKQWSRIFTVNQ